VNWVLDQIEPELRAFYEGRAEADDPGVKVGWREQQAQLQRFAQLVKVIGHDPEAAFELADFGCGNGDLEAYLRLQGYAACQYIGYDRSPEMIANATAGHPPSDICSFVCIDDLKQASVADYAVASGIFSARFSIPDADWLAYILATVATMDGRSRRGFAFNALTKYSDADLMRDELYYADPGLLFDHCKRLYSRNVALLHDYDEYDFTIIVRK
jgi:SAM-dependent methyltransferase